MKQLVPAFLLNIVLIVLTGIVFPLIIWGVAQIAFPHQANGSLVRRADGSILGSEIIGQPFQSAKYFHPRPSAAGSGYDAANSSGTNLGPTSSKLIRGIPDDPTTPDSDESYLGITDLAAKFRQENGLAANAPLPADAVTHSASGLDPDISPANARLQAPRVATARGISPQQVNSLIDQEVKPRFLGIFGEPRVNVLRINLRLDELQSGK